MNQNREKYMKKSLYYTAIGLFAFIFCIYVEAFLTYKDEYVEKHKVFGATYMTMNNEFYRVMNNEIKTQLDKNGDDLIALDPALNQDKQNEQIEYLIEKDVDAIFLNPVDWKGVKPGLEAAKKAGIPIIVVDTPVYNEEYVSATIESDNWQAGVLCAQEMMKLHKSANIVLLTHKNTSSGRDRIDGFLQTIEGHDEYHIVAQADTQGQIERALDKTTKILKQHEDVDVIMALNDPTAMGALAAIDSIRYDWNVSVYGVDGSPEAKKLIQEGLMSGTAAQAPRKMGDSAVSTAYKILEDETYEKNQSISVEMVTEDNIDQFDISRWQ